MPRHPKFSNSHDQAYKQLRNLRLAVQLRAEQVKLRRLEWDTQELALPHITPLPGDSELQRRRSLTQKDMPHPLPPVEIPEFQPGMPSHLMETMMDLYMDQVRHQQERDPYNKLSSKSAQAKAEAKREREQERRDRIREAARRTLEIATAREMAAKQKT